VVLVSFALYVGKANGMSQHAQSWNGKKWADVHVETNAEQYPGPQMPPAQVMPDNPLIFLGTSAYRDIRCGRTVFEAFEKAKHPENIRVGVVDQLGPGDTPCMDSYCKLSEEKHDGKCMYKDHITVTTKDFLDSRGPCPARALQQKMINAEDFCFQVDSHTMLIEDWDEKLIAEWVKTENEYAILSTYCRRIEEYGQNINGVHEVPHLCTTVWGANDMVRNGAPCRAKAPVIEPPRRHWPLVLITVSLTRPQSSHPMLARSSTRCATAISLTRPLFHRCATATRAPRGFWSGPNSPGLGGPASPSGSATPRRTSPTTRT
jgi:hypothetical protein